MPNPVPLATREEEERRAWVTTNHECVRIIKECFGDRFSNNEIFDRLKISRRTGYRALGNDERIGKAPGRKSKINDSTVQSMIEWLETGRCNEVGNVWKYLAQNFAPDCNPKTVQDAVKKAGFKNYHNNDKLGVALDQNLNEHGSPSAHEEATEAAHHLQSDQAGVDDSQLAHQVHQARQAEQAHSDEQARQQSQHHHQQQNGQHQQHQHQQNSMVYDPALHQPQQHSALELLHSAIATFPEHLVRSTLEVLVNRNHDQAMLAHHLLLSPGFPTAQSNMAPPIAQMGMHTHINAQPDMHQHSPAIQSPTEPTPTGTLRALSARKRTAICRRCSAPFSRATNTMNSRSCSYHKGSAQKTDMKSPGTIHQCPEAWTWSCCAGNGSARGCCQAMHTTKKKRKYVGKATELKRSASTAGLDGDGDGVAGDENGNADMEGFDMNGSPGSPGAEDDDDSNAADDSGLADTTLLQGSPPSPQSAAASALSTQDMTSYGHPFGQGMHGPGADVMNMQVPLQMPVGGQVPSDADIDGSLQDHRQAQHPQQSQPVVASQHGHSHHQHGQHQDHQQLAMSGMPMPQSSHDMYGQAQQMMMGHDGHQAHAQHQHQHQQMAQLDGGHHDVHGDHDMSAGMGGGRKIED